MKSLKQICKFLGIGLCFTIGAYLLMCLFLTLGAAGDTAVIICFIVAAIILFGAYLVVRTQININRLLYWLGISLSSVMWNVPMLIWSHFETAGMAESGDIFSYFLGSVFMQAFVFIPLAFILALTVISGLFEIIMYIRKSLKNKCKNVIYKEEI